MDTQRSADEIVQQMTPYGDNRSPGNYGYGQQVPVSAVLADRASTMLIDLPMLWAVFRRRMGLFFGAAITVLAIVTLITFQMTPKYLATADVLIDAREKKAVDIASMISGLPADSAAVDTEVELIKSRTIAEKVTAKEGLYEDPEFNVTLQEKSSLAALKASISNLFPSQMNASLDDAAQERIARERTVHRVMDNLRVERAGTTYMIRMGFESENPKKAARIANAFAGQYLVHQLDAKFDFIRRNKEHLDGRLTELQEEVRAAEALVEQYREENGLFESGGATLTEQQISDINRQLIAQRAELAERRARLTSVNSQLESGVGATSISEVLSSPVIGELRAKQADVSRRKSELATRYGPRHPEMQKVEREETELQSQIDSEVSRIVASLEGEVNIARQRVRALETSLANMRNELAGNNKALVGLKELERQAEASRAIYESFLGSFKETSEQEALTESDAEIASRAAIPTNAHFPNKLLNIALGLILGGGFGALLVMLAEIFDNGLRTAEDIERTLNTDLVTAIPTIAQGLLSGPAGKLVPQDYLVEKPLSSFAESYRTVRSSILLGNDGQMKPKVVALTSALSGEGKTVSSLCLGRICAMSGDKVIVIDCDARRRILSGEVEGIKTGLLEVLSGTGTLKDAVRKDAKTNLHILPVSGAQEGVADVFGSNAFDSLINKLKTKYDLIILDTAPVTAVTDTRTVISAADIVLLMVRWRSTPVKIARSARKILEGLPTPVLGAVLTQVDAKEQTQYGYEGSYAYYQSHKKYYHD